MTEYFEDLGRTVAELGAQSEPKFLEDVFDLERNVMQDVLTGIVDREFPKFHQDAILKIIDWESFLRNYDRAKDHLLVKRVHQFFEVLHGAFHRLAIDRTQTRFGILTDDPAANVKAQRLHDKDPRYAYQETGPVEFNRGVIHRGMSPEQIAEAVPGVKVIMDTEPGHTEKVNAEFLAELNTQGVETGRVSSGDPQQPPDDSDHPDSQEEDGPGPELEDGNVVIILEVTDPHRPLISDGKLPANIKIRLELSGGCIFSSLDADEVISKINSLANSDRREDLKVYHNGKLTQQGPAIEADCSECGGRWKGEDYADEMAKAVCIRQVEESRTRGGMIQGKEGLAALAMLGKLSTDKDKG